MHKTYSFRGRGYTFSIIAHILSFWCQIFLKNVDIYTFWGVGEVWESECFVHSFKCWQLWTTSKWYYKCFELSIYYGHVMYAIFIYEYWWCASELHTTKTYHKLNFKLTHSISEVLYIEIMTYFEINQVWHVWLISIRFHGNLQM